ncbi:MAG: hypothetical protein AAGI24_09435 [Pseudomonadota bacterium]
MNQTELLDQQIERLGFYAAALTICVGFPMLSLPLDIAGGNAAAHADRVLWLVDNRIPFVLAWLVQIVAMVTLTLVLMALLWASRATSLLRAGLALSLLASAFVVFIIPKFMAIWTVPLLAETVAQGREGYAMADALLLLLNVSAPASLFTSFDYLGFWLYSLYGLLAAGLLWKGKLAAKVCAAALWAYGVLYQLLLVSVIFGLIAAAQVEAYALGASALLLVPVFSAIFLFSSSR